MNYTNKIIIILRACAEPIKKLVGNAVISCTAKMIYRNLDRIVQGALNSFAGLRARYDSEKNTEKKERKLIGLKLGGACLQQIGQALIESSKILTQGLQEESSL